MDSRFLRVALTFATAAISSAAMAQENTTTGPTAPDDDGADPHTEAPAEHGDLAGKVVDPGALLLTIGIQHTWSTVHGEDRSTHSIALRPIIPFSAFGVDNILRLTLPYDIETVQGTSGLAATQVLDVAVLPYKATKFLLGAVANLQPNDQTPHRFQIGPSVGVLVTKGPWIFGFLNQNLFGPDYATSLLQPIVGFTAARWLSLGLGDLQITYDFEGEQFVSIPVGLQVNLIAKLAGQPIRIYVNPQYNARDLAGTSKWSLISGVELLLP